MSEKNKKIVSIVVVIVVALVSFYGGMTYGKSQSSANLRTQGGQSFAGGNRGPRGLGAAGFTSGDIISKDTNSITVSLQSGGSKIIFLDTNTKVMKSATGSLSDLTTGTQVSVTGTPNSDGSINATSVQIRPAMSSKPTPTQ